MAEWSTITFKFDIFDPLRPPLEAILTALEVVEAILEALLDLIKPFLLDLLNPLKAVIAALLAALRALINQIRATGVAILLVHPDFSQPDFGGVLYSVSGAYPGFESKVVGKFHDTADIFRPQYPPGSSVAMLVFYIGADSPGDLLGLIFAILALIKHPIQLSALPAPVDVKAGPINKSGDAVSQFRNLFDGDLDQTVQLEWRMPQAPAGSGVAGFVGQIAAFYNAFRFPNFIIERHGPFPQDEGQDQLDARGEVVRIQTDSTTIGASVDPLIERYGFPRVNSKIALREEDGTVHRIFNSKRAIQFGGSDGEPVDGEPIGSPTSALGADTALIRGIATGTYRYLDEDDELVPGRTYYYRIRAFFGDATDYLGLRQPDEVQAAGLAVRQGNQQILRLSPKLTLGRPSRVVKAFVPREEDPADQAFKAYTDVYNAIRAGLLLNFELPPAGPGDSLFRQDQKAGWGTLGLVAGQIGAAKAIGAGGFPDIQALPSLFIFNRSDSLKAELISGSLISRNILFNSTARRLANSIIDKLLDNPAFTDILIGLWNDGVQEVVNRILDSKGVWIVPAIIGGITPEANRNIDIYLSLEEGDPTFHVDVDGISVRIGPFPLSGEESATVEDRLALANFLRTALSVISAQTGYLSWYSVTVGDLFPALTPFLFDFEQFLKDLLNAINSALQELVDIIETLLAKIRALKQIVETLLALLELLKINVTVSVLAYTSTNGSAEDLAQQLLQSESKPGSSPFGLHSGIVLTAGGPGQGFIAALETIKFILGMPFS